MNNKIALEIWGRTFELGIIFQNFPGEDVTADQINLMASVNDLDFSSAKEKIESFIKENYREYLNDSDIFNIFRFVIPKAVLIPRDNKNIIALMCDFKLDMEHGMAVIFKDNMVKDIGPQDIIL